MIDFFVSIYETMINAVVKIGPRRKAKRQHREDLANQLYRDAYWEAFRGKVAADRAWGQLPLTLVLIAAALAFAILWLVLIFLEHNQGMSTLAGIMFWVSVYLLWFQSKYYRQIQAYAIDLAQKELRNDKIKKVEAERKAQAKAAAAAAKQKVKQDAAKAAQVKKARAVRKAAEKKAQVKTQTKPNPGDKSAARLDGLKKPPF